MASANCICQDVCFQWDGDSRESMQDADGDGVLTPKE